MNRKPSDNDFREAVFHSVDSVSAPPFDLAAIEARKGRVATYYPARPRLNRWVLVGLPAALVLAVMVPTMPAVVAQVERALHAFAVVNGQTVPLTVRTVSLDEARAHMPFEVIVPAAVPPGLKQTISAIYSEASAAPARLAFEYRDGNSEIPVLRIEETAVPRATANGAHEPMKVVVQERTIVGGPAGGRAPAGADATPPNQRLGNKNGFWVKSVKVVNGHTTTQTYELHPVTWTVRGTNVMLAAIPGSLSAAQVDAIRAAMSH